MKNKNTTAERQLLTLLICSLVIGFGLLQQPASAQSVKSNSEKYWLYRNRFNEQFIKVGAGQGMSIPAEFYDEIYDCPNPAVSWSGCNNKVLAFSDATAHLGYYIAVMATEHRVLELTGNSTTKTDEELYFALNALWRLDATSGYYGYDDNDYPTCSIPTPSIIPQMTSNNYNDPNLLDGFFIRDDVPFDFHLNWPDIDNITSNLTSPNGNSCAGKNMSQDQVTAILLGLMCVKEFFSASYQYNGVPLRDFAIFEAERIIRHCRGSGDWVLKNPHLPGSPPVTTGDHGVGFSTAEVYACLEFTNNVNLTNPISILQNPIWQALQFPFYLPGGAKYVNEPMISNLAAVGDSWGPCPVLITPGPITPYLQYYACFYTFGATTGETRQGLDRYAARAKEAQYILHHLVYGSNWSNSNNVSETSILAMLNSAPCEGPSSPNPNVGIYGWTTANRFWVPRKNPDGTNDNLLKGKDGSFGQIYNGLDYMLLYNLYYLWRFQNGLGNPFEFPYENLQNAVIDHNWPIQFSAFSIYNGSNQSPIHIRTLETLTSNSKIGSIPNVPATDYRNGNVTYRAGELIDLIDGFEVQPGAYFEAHIVPMECVNGQILRNSGEMSPDELLIKAIYDAADAEDDSLHAELLDSLNMTEEQYAAHWDSLFQGLIPLDTIGANAKTSQLPQASEILLQAFPNPTTANVKVIINLPEAETMSLLLINMEGRVTMEICRSVNMIAGEHVFDLDLGAYPAGLYKLLLQGTQHSAIASIVKS